MRIEKMNEKHLDGVCKIEQQCFVHPWSKESLMSELGSENSLFLVMTDNDRTVGYIGMNFVLDEGYIYNVAVDEAFRRRGVASALIGELVTYGKKHNFSFLTLEVREGNEDARLLYSKLGFIKVGERKNYYSEPTENAVLMTKYF